MFFSTRRRKLGLFLAFLVVLVVGAFLAAPSFVRWRIHRDHPDVHVSSVTLHWKTVDLHGVRIDRPWVTGTLDHVTSTWNGREISVRGGQVIADLDKRPSGSSGERRALTFEDLNVVLVKGTSRAEMLGASFKDDQLCFKSGEVHHQFVSSKTGAGCVSKDQSFASLANAEVTLHGIPHLPEGQVIKITNAKAEIPYKKGSLGRVELDVLDHREQRTHVVLTGVSLSQPESNIQLNVETLAVTHPWLSPEAVTFHNVSTSFTPQFSLPEDIDVAVNGAKVHIEPKGMVFTGEAPCQTWANALPDGLRHGPLVAPEFTGTLSFNVHLKPKPSVKISSSCKMSCGAPSIRGLKQPFQYIAYDAQGKEFERETGPTTKDWTPYSSITSFMSLAVMEMEDRYFPYHKGFIPEAFENSLTEDLRVGRFARGGSTITMQLAKNLWLRRDKTIGRKVEELLLTQALEGCFSKDALLELYLNVVELGPNLYGVGPAAKHYFNSTPRNLDPAQTFYLASLLPNPKKAPPPTEAVLQRMGELMKQLVNAGRIPPGITILVGEPDMAGWEQP